MRAMGLIGLRLNVATPRLALSISSFPTMGSGGGVGGARQLKVDDLFICSQPTHRFAAS